MGSSQEEQLGAGKMRPARGIYGGLGSAAQAQLRPPPAWHHVLSRSSGTLERTWQVPFVRYACPTAGKWEP